MTPTVLDHSRTLPQGDGCARPAFTRRAVGGECNLIILDAGDVLHMLSPSGVHVSPREVNRVLNVVIFAPFLPHSSSSSRFTAGASAFFILSQSGERPEP